jgi:hypothetical protein
VTEPGWEPVEPREAPALLARLRTPWWIAGGWALDLFLGGAPRPHKDLDVAVLRRDLAALRSALADWDVRVAKAGRLRAWDGGLADDEHVLWARPRGAARWLLEFVVDEADGDAWRFRRDPRVVRPLASFGLDLDGLPVLAPEIVLLYKAKGAGEAEDDELRAVVPRLRGEPRTWLRRALELVHPGHAWLAELA